MSSTIFPGSESAALRPEDSSQPTPEQGKTEGSTDVLNNPPVPNAEPAAEAANAEANICLNCGHHNRIGELICAKCSAQLDPKGRTQQLEKKAASNSKSWPTGDVIVSEQKVILLEINDETLALPVAEAVTIGRDSGVNGDPLPDVTLNNFSADTKGVSRQHIKIQRKGSLIYIVDLGSTNGTFLNGRRLVRYSEHLLRDGDEIHLSHLKFTIRFRDGK
jgi:pSer/pThr/pTyr-binding forkhead associated (FHA) protein